jgi:hypothetical protein
MFNFKEIMKAILYKRDDDFYSLKVDGIVMATSNGMLVDYRLSLKNCQAIECCVDLDTLVLSFYPKTEWDVEIEMEDSIGIGDKYTPEPKPLLDSEGCLILKRKI